MKEQMTSKFRNRRSLMAKKYIVLDTETTGLETEQGHRIIEIGALMLEDRKKLTTIFMSI